MDKKGGAEVVCQEIRKPNPEDTPVEN